MVGGSVGGDTRPEGPRPQGSSPHLSAAVSVIQVIIVAGRHASCDGTEGTMVPDRYPPDQPDHRFTHGVRAGTVPSVRPFRATGAPGTNARACNVKSRGSLTSPASAFGPRNPPIVPSSAAGNFTRVEY